MDKYLNNKGASGPGSNFDGTGTYFKCSTDYKIGTLDFKYTDHKDFDNIVSLGQMIPLPNEHFGAIYLLGSVNHGPITTNIAIFYQDGTQTMTSLNIPDWQVQHIDQITRLDLYRCSTNAGYAATMFSIPLLTDATKPVSHLILPYTNPIGSYQPSLHLFGITAIPSKKTIKIISVIGTTRWWEKSLYQIITVSIHNTSPDWIHDTSIFIKGTLLKTKYHGYIKRLAPGHKVTVDVVILNLRKKREKVQVLVQVVNSFGEDIIDPIEIDQVEIGLDDYTSE